MNEHSVWSTATYAESMRRLDLVLTPDGVTGWFDVAHDGSTTLDEERWINACAGQLWIYRRTLVLCAIDLKCIFGEEEP